MSETADTTYEGISRGTRRTSALQRLLGSPLLWGGAVTWCFYALIPFIPVQREMVERYFCSHPLEYALAGLFWVGVAILCTRRLRMMPERAAFNALDLSGIHPAEDGPPITASRIDRLVELQNDVLQQTDYAERVKDLTQFVHNRKSGDGLDEHLQHRADQAFDRLHESYDLFRTITWAVPILGFLGTVIGITLAIANLNPEQLAGSLQDVTGGLAVAFDTTALSLALSLILVFARLLVERGEQRMLVEVEEEISRHATRLFPVTAGHSSGLLQAQTRASDKLLNATEELVTRQVDMWEQSLEGMRDQWNRAIAQQSSDLNSSLSEGMTATLSEHDKRLAQTSTQLSQAMGEAAGNMHSSMEELCRQTTEVQQRMLERFEALARQGQASQREMIDQIGQLASQGQASQSEMIEQFGQLTRQGQASQQQMVDQINQLTSQGQLSQQQMIEQIGQFASLGHARQQELVEQIGQLTSHGQAQLEQTLEAQSARLASLSDSVAERISRWQVQLEETTRVQLDSQETLHAQTRALQELAGSELEMAATQKLLADNLEVLRAADTIESAVQNLTGAVHLLTARVKPRNNAA